MVHVRPSIADKRRTFHQLHEAGCFVIPNPWDVGSARYLQGLGFKALATTSSGFAWSHGHRDGGMSRDRVIEHLAGMIEDSTGHAAQPLYELDAAVERLRAARRAIDKAGGETLLVGRAECFLHGRADIELAVQRLKAYANAGADCLYAPGIRAPEHIVAVVTAVAPKPVNFLMAWAGDLTLQEIGALGVRRVSVGGALARAAWGGFMRAAKLIMEQGRFDGFKDAASGKDLDTFFS
jgi:2-methylisocitrate lyase-like PEP mutase family enzyme